jgi:hypothetical protein
MQFLGNEIGVSRACFEGWIAARSLMHAVQKRR